MTEEEFLKVVLRTASTKMSLPEALLGVSGECGELVDLLKKELYHGHPRDNEKVLREIGDILWYLTWIAHSRGLSLSKSMTAVNEKLLKRYPEKFTTENSINRGE